MECGLNPKPECHNAGCTNPAPNRCAGCKFVHYCSKVCQRAHWPTHKPICKKTESTTDKNLETARAEGPVNNAVRILPGHFSDRESLRQLVKPFRLESWKQIGDEVVEKREIMHRFGWGKVVDGGKCYYHKDTNSWYYLVYIDPTKKKKTAARNEVVDLVTERRSQHRLESFVAHDHGVVHAEVVWIRSGPVGDFTPEEILLDDVVDTILYYQTHAPLTLWHERERSRFIRKSAQQMGVDPKTLYYLR